MRNISATKKGPGRRPPETIERLSARLNEQAERKGFPAPSPQFVRLLFDGKRRADKRSFQGDFL